MRAQGGISAGPASAFEPASNIIRARNDSGAAIARFGVLEISGVVIDPTSNESAAATFQDSPVVAGVEPTDPAKPFVIAVEPIADGAIGRVAASGVVPVKLDVTAEADTTAASKAGSTGELKTGSGPAAIVWKASGTGGGKWGLVRFGGGGGGDKIRLCKTTAQWTSGSQQTLHVYDGTPPDETHTAGETLEAWNYSHLVSADVFVIVAKASNDAWYLVEACNPTQDDEAGGDEGTGGCSVPSVGGQDLTGIAGYSEGKMQVLGHASGCLRWLDVEDCPEL